MRCEGGAVPRGPGWEDRRGCCPRGARPRGFSYPTPCSSSPSLLCSLPLAPPDLSSNMANAIWPRQRLCLTPRPQKKKVLWGPPGLRAFGGRFGKEGECPQSLDSWIFPCYPHPWARCCFPSTPTALRTRMRLRRPRPRVSAWPSIPSCLRSPHCRFSDI